MWTEALSPPGNTPYLQTDLSLKTEATLCWAASKTAPVSPPPPLSVGWTERLASNFIVI